MSRAKAPEHREGRPRAAKSPDHTQLVPASAPTPPDTLGEIGRRVWNEVWSAGAGAYVAATDHFAIARYAELHERRLVLLEIAAEDGYVSVGSTGQPAVHPALRAVDSIETKLAQLEDRLGLNPDSRIRLGLSAAELRSELDVFLEE
ncbi:phage terminase small subunit P27 family [Crossiella sp. NPDC003009]